MIKILLCVHATKKLLGRQCVLEKLYATDWHERDVVRSFYAYLPSYKYTIALKITTYLRCIRTRASRASCKRPISWLRLSYSCLRSSMSGSVLVPVGTSSSLSVGIWLILSIGICSGGAGATYRRRGGFRGVAFADRFRAKTLNNVTLPFMTIWFTSYNWWTQKWKKVKRHRIKYIRERNNRVNWK